MKKLFYIFAILFTVFNTTAWGDDDFFKDFNKFKEEMSSSQSNFIAKMNQDGCLAQKEIEGSGLWMGSPELLPKNCQEIIISLTNENGPYTQQATGACNGIPYTCNPGDLPSDCNPCKIGDTLFKYNNDIANEYKKLACENNPTTDQSSSQDQQKWMTIACNTLASTTKVTKQISTTKTNITSDENKIASAPTNQGTQKSTTSNTITISGTVTDGIEPSVSATVQALDSDNKLIKGTITDIDGKYTLENIPDNAKIKISYLGFKTQTLSIYEADKKTITLQEASQKLTEVTVKSCEAEDLENLNASDRQLHYESNTCIPLICKTGFTLVTADYKPYKMSSECQENVNSDECAFVDFGIKCLKTTGNCATDKQADTSKYELKEGTYVCEIKTCKSGYKPNGDNTACIKMAKKCNDVDRKKLEDAGASDTGLRAGTETCIALDCKCGYTLNGEKCDPWEKDQNGKYTKPCEESDLEKLNAKSGILACNDRGKAFCEITECISSDYTHNTEKNTCDSKNKTPCDPMPENTTDAEYRTVDGKLVCIINKCADGYERNADKTKCNPTPKLSQEDSKKKIAELQENADAMRAKEQSTENKLLGGATMAATGIGGMQAMSAMAEQSADADAEEAMRAYLATFHCNYGGGMNIPGGEKDVQLPGGNELVGLYSEYVNLANDLKVRKNALGMKPGIESESILDSATSGLYDDIAIGKTSGAFTSLARALQNPDGPDASVWAAQKSDTANKLKTGATIAGIGAVGGAVGNLLINNDKDDDKLKNSDAKKEDKKFDKQKVGQDDVKKLTDTVKQKVSKPQQQQSGGQNESQNQVVADAVVVASVTEISDGDVTAQATVSGDEGAQDIDNSNITDSNATLDALAQEFGKQPSDSVRAAWNKFAEQCGGYKGILSLEKSVAHAGGYELLCEFVDLEQTDEIIKDFYATELGHDYFTTNNINHELQIEKMDAYKKSRYGQNDIKAWERMAEMNSSWSNSLRYVDVGDGKSVSADGKYRALIYMKPDMSLVMNKHNNDNMTEYTVK